MNILIYIVVIWLIVGVLAWLINSAPFIDGQIKPIAIWFLIAAGVIISILQVWPMIPGI